MFTQQEKKFNKWSIKNISRVHYTFTQKFTYNKNIASLLIYRNPVVVWKTNRVDYTKRDKPERRADSVQRARERLYDLVSANIGQYKEMTTFITLTFAENITDLKEANVLFRSFIRRLNRHIGYKVKYITVVEFQKRGAVHYHMLFFNMPFIPKFEFEAIWGHGFTNMQGLETIRNVSAYLAKYLSKETFDKRLVGQKVYFSSRGLLRSEVTRDNIVIDNQLPNYKSNDVILSTHITKIKYERKRICDIC